MRADIVSDLFHFGSDVLTVSGPAMPTCLRWAPLKNSVYVLSSLQLAITLPPYNLMQVCTVRQLLYIPS